MAGSSGVVCGLAPTGAFGAFWRREGRFRDIANALKGTFGTFNVLKGTFRAFACAAAPPHHLNALPQPPPEDCRQAVLALHLPRH
jgi:hypothetical protein